MKAAPNHSGDKTWTPEIVAKDMIKWFKPEGKILEPCYGNGNIYKFLPKGSSFCEISMGKDFYNYNEKVDWIITNPPFSKYRKFILHGLTLSNNSVWLMPTWKFFLSDGLIRNIYEYGGIKEIRHYATGSKLGWKMGNGIAAIHIQKKYEGDISFSLSEVYKSEWNR